MFTTSCFHCIESETGQTVHSPLDHAIHRGIDVLHLDFGHMVNSQSLDEYVLIKKYDLTSYVGLLPFISLEKVSSLNCS